MHTLQVTPSKYDLLLKPDLKQFTFEGEVTIHVDVSEETKTVSLHAKEVIVVDPCMPGTSWTIFRIESNENQFELFNCFCCACCYKLQLHIKDATYTSNDGSQAIIYALSENSYS